MTHRARTWLFLVILVGAGASLTSLYVYDQVVGDPTYTSFCNFNQAFNCDAIYRSRFATFRGVPVALAEVIWWTLAWLLILGATIRSIPEEAAPYLFAISIPAVSVVLFEAYASLVILETVSICCAITYLAVLAVFLISGACTTVPFAGVARQLRRDAHALAVSPLPLAVAMVFLTATIAAIAYFARPAATPSAALIAALARQPTDFDLWFESQVRTPVGLPAGDARVLIVKFTDYQCAACAESYPAERSALARHERTQPGAVRIVVKDYPQDRECHPNVARESHEAACEAAVAVRLAERHQRGQAMEEWLYSHHSDLTPRAVREAAQAIGEIPDFESEYPQVLPLIRQDIDLGLRLGVKTVPTFFINGVRVEGRLTPDFLDQAIAHELSITAAKP